MFFFRKYSAPYYFILLWGSNSHQLTSSTMLMTLKSPALYLFFELLTYLISPKCISWNAWQHSFILPSPLSQSNLNLSQIWNLIILIPLPPLNSTFKSSASPVDSVSKYVTHVYSPLNQAFPTIIKYFLLFLLAPVLTIHFFHNSTYDPKISLNMTYKTQNDLSNL